MKELLPESGRFYKVNPHCHTNISDGQNTPEEVKKVYKALGYSAVCFMDHEVLIDAFEKGHCYVSEGPEILSLTMEDGRIRVKTSEAVNIVLRGEGRYAEAAVAKEQLLICAEFDYEPEKLGAFFRIELRDAAGNRAYSNAYFTDSL